MCYYGLVVWKGRGRAILAELGRTGPALFAGTNNSDSSINKISSTSYFKICANGKTLEHTANACGPRVD